MLILVPPSLDAPTEALRRSKRGRRISRRPRFDWRLAQGHLPLRLPAKTVTPLMEKIFSLLKRRAEARLAMPTNIEMGEMIGGRGRQSIAKALDKLEALRRIRVDTKRGARRVYIPSRGAMTGWGEHRLGHAPFCTNPRGSVSVEKPPAPQSIGRGEGFKILGVSYADQYGMQAVIFSGEAPPPARSCQFIEGGGGWCNKKSMAGKSWCQDHFVIVFRPSRPKKSFTLT